MSDSSSKSSAKKVIHIIGLGVLLLIIVTFLLQLLYKQVDLEVHSVLFRPRWNRVNVL